LHPWVFPRPKQRRQDRTVREGLSERVWFRTSMVQWGLTHLCNTWSFGISSPPFPLRGEGDRLCWCWTDSIQLVLSTPFLTARLATNFGSFHGRLGRRCTSRSFHGLPFRISVVCRIALPVVGFLMMTSASSTIRFRKICNTFSLDAPYPARPGMRCSSGVHPQPLCRARQPPYLTGGPPHVCSPLEGTVGVSRLSVYSLSSGF
jgi:hypothetical protein